MEGRLKKVTFARTPIMSSYLLAFIVGEFDFVEETDSNGVRVRVYTPVGKADDGKFALNVSCYMSQSTSSFPPFPSSFSSPTTDLACIPVPFILPSLSSPSFLSPRLAHRTLQGFSSVNIANLTYVQ